LLYVLNIFRIILLYAIGTTYHQLFDIFHTTLFPIIFILFALFFWIIWIQRFTSKK
jgi:exosortase/archaeosortase family protein